MDITSTVRTDTLPAIGTVVVPGSVAASPYASLLLLKFGNLAEVLGQNEVLAILALIVFVIGSGLLVESIGSYFEYYVLDNLHADKKKMLREWRRYLCICWKIEPVGQSYLRRVLTVFKFELNLFVGSSMAVPGIIWLRCEDHLSTTVFVTFLLFVALLLIYLFIASRDSSLLLAGIRQDLLAQSRRQGEPSIE